MLCARLVRAYARDPVGGAAGFARAGPHAHRPGLARATRSTAPTSRGSRAAATRAADERHPVRARLRPDARRARDAPRPRPAGGRRPPSVPEADARRADPRAAPAAPGTPLQPAALHALLHRARQPDAPPQQVAVAWYRERAAPHLVPFPRAARRPTRPSRCSAGSTRGRSATTSPTVDWTGTVTASPVVVPGMTTVQRAYLEDEAVQRAAAPGRPRPLPRLVGLDARPAASLRADRARRRGARAVGAAGRRAGAGDDVERPRPGRGHRRVHPRRRRGAAARSSRTSAAARPSRWPCSSAPTSGADGAPPTATGPTHVAVVSDDGVTTMFRPWTGRRARRRATVAARALAAAGGGGSLVLQTPGVVPRADRGDGRRLRRVHRDHRRGPGDLRAGLLARHLGEARARART